MSETGDGLAFNATVVAPSRGSGALVVLPEGASEAFGTRARVAVRATFNDVAHRGSAMPMGDGRFALGLTQAVRAAAGVEIGDTVHVTVQRDVEERTVDVSADLATALRDAGLEERFAALAYTHRREYVTWVTEAKRAETRANRVAKTVTMVGERRVRS